MRRRDFLIAAAFAAPVFGQGRAPRIGAILFSHENAPTLDGLRAGLKELGVIEGRDYVLDVVDAAADRRTVEEAARRFEREKVALLFATPTSGAVPAVRATKEVPVFFTVGTDPLAAGLAQSHAKPGGRATGILYLTGDLTGKRLELLKDLLPKMHRVLTVYNPDNPPAQASVRVGREAAKKLGVELIERHARSVAEVRALIAALKPGEADAYVQVADALFSSQFEHMIPVAKKIRMPMMVYDQTVVERGALMSYGVDIRAVGRQAAKNVQRLLAGAKPAELPVETVSQLSFAFNRRTAREMGLSVPQAMLLRADRVIE